MKARVKWVEGMTYVGESGSGHAVVMDGPPDLGGRNLGVRPMEMLLLGLGGCTMYDVVNILQKQRQDLVDLTIEIDGRRSEEGARPWQTIHLRYIATGRALDPKKVERAIDLSVEKYCGAHATLGAVATITHEYEIRSEG